MTTLATANKFVQQKREEINGVVAKVAGVAWSRHVIWLPKLLNCCGVMPRTINLKISKASQVSK